MSPIEYLTIGIAVGAMVARLALFLAAATKDQDAHAA